MKNIVIFNDEQRLCKNVHILCSNDFCHAMKGCTELE